MPFPKITLLTPHKLVATVTIVIGGPSILPIVLMIRDEVGINAVVFEDFGH